MLDTMKSSSHYMPHVGLMGGSGSGPMPPASRHDDELLRQQEAFINQNRMHIEKRRHERSPDRDRDRSYTPPPPSSSSSANTSAGRRRPYSRERELGSSRKPLGTGSAIAGSAAGNNSNRRRAGSREPTHNSHGSALNKRRKSSSPERRLAAETTSAHSAATAKQEKVN